MLGSSNGRRLTISHHSTVFVVQAAPISVVQAADAAMVPQELVDTTHPSIKAQHHSLFEAGIFARYAYEEDKNKFTLEEKLEPDQDIEKKGDLSRESDAGEHAELLEARVNVFDAIDKSFSQLSSNAHGLGAAVHNEAAASVPVALQSEGHSAVKLSQPASLVTEAASRVRRPPGRPRGSGKRVLGVVDPSVYAIRPRDPAAKVVLSKEREAAVRNSPFKPQASATSSAADAALLLSAQQAHRPLLHRPPAVDQQLYTLPHPNQAVRPEAKQSGMSHDERRLDGRPHFFASEKRNQDAWISSAEPGASLKKTKPTNGDLPTDGIKERTTTASAPFWKDEQSQHEHELQVSLRESDVVDEEWIANVLRTP